jgi:hypothetical protein
MTDLIRNFFLQLTQEKKIIASVCAVLGWFNNLFLLDFHAFTWEFIIRGCMGLCMSAVTVCVGLIIKDFYAIKLKHKIFTNEKKDKGNKGSEAEKAA